MTKNPKRATRKDSSKDAAALQELQEQIEEGDLDTELIARYIMFCELRGSPTELMQEKALFALDYLKAQSEARPAATRATTSNNTGPQVQIREQHAPMTREALAPTHGTMSIEDQSKGWTMDPEIVQSIASTLASTAATMSIAYWQIKSFEGQTQAAEAQRRAAQEEAAMAIMREDARRSSARWDQLSIWSFTMAAKFGTDYIMKTVFK